MSSRGYIKFYRSTLTHPFFRDDAERMAWLRLLSAAAWKPQKKRAGEFFVELQRGEVVGAVRYLAAEWAWSKGKVERFLARMAAGQLVSIEIRGGLTILKISDYDEYVGGSEPIEIVEAGVSFIGSPDIALRRLRPKNPARPHPSAEMASVYILTCGASLTKVGISSNVTGRIAALQTANPHEIRLAGRSEDLPRTKAVAVEQLSLSLLGDVRLKGEWLQCEASLVADMVDRVLRMNGHSPVSRCLPMETA